MDSTPDIETLDDVRSRIVTCEACPRLREYCARIAVEKKRAHRLDTYWGRPVPGFGDPGARLLLVALAPAAHGANRTGRVFTGDGPGGSGHFLMTGLHAAGFASIPTSDHPDDGLVLRDVYIASAVRCAPPDNKPAPDEMARCLRHLADEAALLPRVRVVVALGKIAFDAWLTLLRSRGVAMTPRPRFAHGGIVRVTGPDGTALPTLVGCYHPSRQNTNTGVFTQAMLRDVIALARRLIDEPATTLPTGGPTG